MAEPRVNQTDSQSFLRLLGHTITEHAEAGQSAGLVIVHLENFAQLIPVFGYQTGNRLICVIAERLAANIRRQDKIVRIGESKFAVIISSLRNRGILVLAANKLGKICTKPITVDGHEISVRMRIGIATGPDQGQEPETLLQNAETALLAAATEDEDFAFFSHDQQTRASDSLRLDVELEVAIENNEFELYFQPKVSTPEFLPCGAEALIRWNSRERGFVSPEVFIPLAERTGRVEPLTSFVMNAAMQHASRWPSDLGVSINISPKMLQSSELVEMVSIALKLWDFDPGRLIIEITEGALIENPESSFQVMSSLRSLGVKISIDDFGAGYSSFSYFKNIPADELKIDKSFVLNVFEDFGDRKIVGAIVQLSKQFGLIVTAEGVEDERTAKILAELGCDRLQGFHYSRPLPHNEFLDWTLSYSARIAKRA